VARSQCEGINQMEYGVNHWVGHAYQLNSTARPTNYNNFFDHVYKGKLTDDLLGVDDMTIDITFDDQFEFPNDNAYFETTCGSVQKKYFGINFRSQYTVPHEGVYEIKVNQDDGATLRLNGTLVHNMWANFNHTVDTERRHYLTYK